MGSGCSRQEAVAVLPTPSPGGSSTRAIFPKRNDELEFRSVTRVNPLSSAETARVSSTDVLPIEGRPWSQVSSDRHLIPGSAFLHGTWAGSPLQLAYAGSYGRDENGKWVIQFRIPANFTGGESGSSSEGTTQSSFQAPSLVFDGPPMTSTPPGPVALTLISAYDGELVEYTSCGKFSVLASDRGGRVKRGVVTGLKFGGDTFEGSILVVPPVVPTLDRLVCRGQFGIRGEALEPVEVEHVLVGNEWRLIGGALRSLQFSSGTLIISQLTFRTLDVGTFVCKARLDTWPRPVTVNLQEQVDGKWVTKNFPWVTVTYTVTRGGDQSTHLSIDLNIKLGLVEGATDLEVAGTLVGQLEASNVAAAAGSNEGS